MRPSFARLSPLASLFPTRPALIARLRDLHALSLAQEAEGYGVPTPTSSGTGIRGSDAKQKGVIYPDSTSSQKDLKVFADKLVALDEDKAAFIYLMLRASNARRVFEAGTSFGVSTAYLVAAVHDNLLSYPSATSSHAPRVWGTELEPFKVRGALENLRQCFSDDAEEQERATSTTLQMLEGQITETLPRAGIERESVDAVLLDIWAPVALPTLKLLTPSLRPGAQLFTDNSITGTERYSELYAHLADPTNGWTSLDIPFQNGLRLSVKTH